MSLATIHLDLEQLRVLSKSVSRSRDAELKKLGRLKEGTPVHDQARSDYMVLDRVDAEIATAISSIVDPTNNNEEN